MSYDYSEVYTREQWERRAAQLWARYTKAQIDRLYRRAWDKLRARSGSGSWDMPTLAMVYPEYLNAFRVIQTASYYAGKTA